MHIIQQFEWPEFCIYCNTKNRDLPGERLLSRGMTICSSAEISEALRAFLMFVVVGQVKTWYTAKDVKHAFALRMAD